MTEAGDLVEKLSARVALNVKDIRVGGHLTPQNYGPIASVVAELLARLGKVAGLAAGALAWPPEAVATALAEDPERFTSIDVMVDADFEEGLKPPDDFDSRARAINGVKNALEFTVFLFLNIQDKPDWQLHMCASDAYTRSLGKQMGRFEQKSIALAMKSFLGDKNWFMGALGTTQPRMEELTKAIVADGAVIQDTIAALFRRWSIPYDMPNAKKNSARRAPYQKPTVSPDKAATGVSETAPTTLSTESGLALTSARTTEMARIAPTSPVGSFCPHELTPDVAVSISQDEPGLGYCPSGHRLAACGVSRDDGWKCDGISGVCKSGYTEFYQTSGADRFRCNHCDVDLCIQCAKESQDAKEVKDAAFKTAPTYDQLNEPLSGDDLGVGLQSRGADAALLSGSTSARERRFDFGPGWCTRCSACNKRSWNRGDEATRKIFCEPCFLNRHPHP